MAKVELKNVSKAYGNKTIIENFNVEIEAGEMIVVVGPSGCGKSTILRMIAGLEEVSSGDIIINGENVSNLEPKDRNIAMVFQNYALYPHMTVYQNMAYGLRMRKVEKNEIKRRVNKTAELLELTDLLHRKPRELSGGQRQRVAMGRAIIRKPAIYLFDEPLSNLDAKLRLQTRVEIKKLQRELGITSIYVTHDQVEAMTLADRLIVMQAGRVEQFDCPLKIYQRPETMFVGSFIGSPAMNFLPVKIIGEHANQILLANNKLLTLASHLTQQPQADVMLGVRPEDIRLADNKADSQMCLQVNLIEQLGTDIIAYGQLIDHRNTMLTLRLPSNTNIAINDEIELFIKPETIHLFDKQTSQRLN